MSLSFPLRIGTRASPLARFQADQVRLALAAAWPELDPVTAFEITPIRTTGDRVQDRRLAEVGGKGLFVKELEQALVDGRCDIAVHSMKDVETCLDPRFVIAAVLPREDPRDALIAPGCRGLDDLPEGATIGTASLRRQAQLLLRRPDLRIGLLRGSVNTRLDKVENGEMNATLLALAGLRRLGLADRATAVLAPDEMLPAAAQGAIGVECAADAGEIRERLSAINHAPTDTVIACERALLGALDGSCRTPVGAHAELTGDRIRLRGLLARPDGTRSWTVAREGAAAEAVAIGHDAGMELRARGDADLMDP